MFKIDCDAYGTEILEYSTISEALQHNRIVKISPVEINGERFFEVNEECDEHFRARLTPEQLLAWGEELIELSQELQ